MQTYFWKHQKHQKRCSMWSYRVLIVLLIILIKDSITLRCKPCRLDWCEKITKCAGKVLTKNWFKFCCVLTANFWGYKSESFNVIIIRAAIHPFPELVFFVGLIVLPQKFAQMFISNLKHNIGIKKIGWRHPVKYDVIIYFLTRKQAKTVKRKFWNKRNCFKCFWCVKLFDKKHTKVKIWLWKC